MQHSTWKRALFLVTASIFLASCGGSGFVPNPGPYLGQFMDGQQAAGDFSLTAGDRVIAGTGTLEHNGGTITVSISGIVNERVINGTVSNSLQGSGAFSGSFLGASTCAGTFSFTDTLGLATTTGTWSANLPQ